VTFKSYSKAIRVTRSFDVKENQPIWRADALFDKGGHIKRKACGALSIRLSKDAKQYSVDGYGEPDIKVAAEEIKRVARHDGFCLIDAVSLHAASQQTLDRSV
jgi:hypothetical protein